MDLERAVEKLLSTDSAEQKAAEQTLASFLEREYQQTVLLLSEIVKNAAHSDTVQQSAALAFKNAIYAKDPEIKARRQDAWMAVPPSVRGMIKQNILEALKTDNAVVGRSIAQCVANIALAEIVRSEWQDLLPFLSSSIMSSETGNVAKQSYLEAIGYICEEISTQAVRNYSNEILSAIVLSMQKEQPSVEIRFAATTALYNSLDFFKTNFETERERNYIMTVVCEATQADDARLRIGALQCVVKILQYYYEFMHPYMKVALFPISYQAMSATVPEITLQGIEFWSTVCETEINLNFEEAEARDEGRTPANRSYKFSLEYLEFVVPCLLTLLAQQPEVDEGDDWVPSKAASVCLMLIAQCVQKAVLEPVIIFVDQNIYNPDWRFRDAACVAFGSVLEGPEPEYLRTIVIQAYDVILAKMDDGNVAVRDSAAWVVQRMCQLMREAVLVPNRFQNTVQILCGHLNDPPRVASNVCWALGTLAQASYEAAQGSGSEIPATSALSSAYEAIVGQLLTIVFRPDADQNNLRTAAFGALGEFLSHAPQDCYPFVLRYSNVIFSQLNAIIQKDPQLSASERHQHGDFCQHFLALLQTVLKRLRREELSGVTEQVYVVCDSILKLHPLGRSFQAEPEAFMCLYVMLEGLQDMFSPFVERVKPHIMNALKAYHEHSLVNSALAFVGELCRVFDVKIMPLIGELLDAILHIIAHVSDPSGLMKPKAVQTLGDIAISLNTHFQNYALMSFECLMAISVPQDHDVWLEILDAILDASLSILNGLKGNGETWSQDARSVVHHYTKFIISLISHVATENGSSSVQDSTILSSAGLIGELCGLFGTEVLPLLDRADFIELLQKGKKSSKGKTKTFSSWALREVKKLRSAQGAPSRK